MADIIPKITDVSSLKGLSAILALPLLCVAYIFQTGPVILFDGSILIDISSEDSAQAQLQWLLIIFTLKSLWVSFFGALIYSLITLLHDAVQFPVVQLASIILLAFGLLGIFGSEHFAQLKILNSFWFYSSLVWGLFLHSMREQLDNVT